MTRGHSRSGLSLSQRREKASTLFLKGLTVAAVARQLRVTWDTAKAYKEWHEQRLREQVAENPQLLSDVLGNTVAMLAELDQIRAAAWTTYHTSESKQVKLQALNTIRSAQQDKAKLFGLFGIKQDMYALIANVRAVQDLLLDFLTRELCSDDKAKVEHFLMRPELQRYMGAPALPELEMGSDDDVVDAEILEDVPA